MPANRDLSTLATQRSIIKCELCKDHKWVDVKCEDGIIRSRQCECLVRENKMRRLKSAEVPIELKDHKINDFKLDLYCLPQNKELAAKAKRMAASYVKGFEEYRGMGKGLYLYSTMPGSGKTRLAVSIGNALWEKYGVSVGFMTVIGVLEKIKGTWDKDDKESMTQSQESLIKTICDADVFIFDDIGTERPTAWVEQILFHIIDTRKTRLKPTIFTSNCAAENLLYHDKLIQRISSMAIPIPFPEESVRNGLTMAENERLQMKLLSGE